MTPDSAELVRSDHLPAYHPPRWYQRVPWANVALCVSSAVFGAVAALWLR